MADEFDWDDDNDPQNDNNSNTATKSSDSNAKGLRAHAKKVDEENRALKARLDEFEKAARTDRVAKAVKDKGLDPAVAGVVPDAVASDTAALEKWLTDNEKLFAKAQKQEDQMVSVGIEDDELVEDEEGYMRLSRVSQGSMPAAKAADALAMIRNAKTREELNDYMRSQGNKFVDYS